ncbi:hypothetical protein C7S17_4537 [Burkholderia thailandensis]|nr:hypothetical protein [Burkholderia thailandensis]
MRRSNARCVRALRGGALHRISKRFLRIGSRTKAIGRSAWKRSNGISAATREARQTTPRN